MVDGILVNRLISTDHGLDISYSRNKNVLPYIGSQSCVGIFSTTSMSGVHLQANKKPAQLPCVHSCLQMNTACHLFIVIYNLSLWWHNIHKIALINYRYVIIQTTHIVVAYIFLWDKYQIYTLFMGPRFC